MSTFSVGDRVQWTSQSAGYTSTKIGVVETIIPAGATPPKTSKSPQPGAARDHVSYLVRVKGKGLYWPRVKHLSPVVTLADRLKSPSLLAEVAKARAALDSQETP